MHRARSRMQGGAPSSFSLWSPTDAGAHWTLTDEGKTATRAAAGWRSLRATTGRASGKYYFEIRMIAAEETNNMMVGLASSGADVTTFLGNSAYGLGIRIGDTFQNGFTSVGGANFAAFSVGSVARIAVDFGNGLVWIGQDGSWRASGNPEGGTNHSHSFTPATVGTLYPAIAAATTSVSPMTVVTTLSSFAQLIPSGFSAWG